MMIPEHAAHEQQMLWDLCWVEEGWAVWAQAGQEGPGSPGAVLAGATQPEPPQVGAGPLSEAQGRNQLWSQGWLGLTAAPLFDNHWRNCSTENKGQVGIIIIDVSLCMDSISSLEYLEKSTNDDCVTFARFLQKSVCVQTWTNKNKNYVSFSSIRKKPLVGYLTSAFLCYTSVKWITWKWHN